MLGKRVLVVLNIDENAKASHKLDDVALQRDTRKQEALREAWLFTRAGFTCLSPVSM